MTDEAIRNLCNYQQVFLLNFFMQNKIDKFFKFNRRKQDSKARGNGKVSVTALVPSIFDYTMV